MVCKNIRERGHILLSWVGCVIMLFMEQSIEQKINAIIQVLDALAIAVKEGFEQVDKRFEQVDKRFEQVDKRFEEVESQLRAVKQDVENIRLR